MLPKVDRTKLEITSPQFRVVERTSSIDGVTMYYPQKRCFIFWFKMATGRAGRSAHKIYYKDSLIGAFEFIENYRKKSVVKDKIHYL